MSPVQPVIHELASLPFETLSDDLPQPMIDRCVALLDLVSSEISIGDARTLLALLPETDDDLFGVNWTVLHAIEACKTWPDWDALDAKNGFWSDLLRQRCIRAGMNSAHSA